LGTIDRAEKKDIIRKWDRAGVFMIKKSVVYLANVFGASRYTIYNCLKEMRNLRRTTEGCTDDEGNPRIWFEVFGSGPEGRLSPGGFFRRGGP